MYIFRLLPRFLAAFLLLPSLLYSQHGIAPPMVFGKVAEEDLKMTTFEADTVATALVLCNYASAVVENPSGSIHLRWEHHKRIKILKKQGFEYGDISIPFYTHNKRESFYFDKAEVHLPDGKRVKLGKKDIFIEKLNEYWSVAKFTFPQMEVGCTIEYAYFINSESIHELREWFFQEDIPVRHSELRVDFPEFLRYVYLFQGNEFLQKVDEKNGEVIYAGKNGTCRISNNRFVMQDAPALRPEAYITTMQDYLAKINFQLSEVHYPDGRKEKMMTTWKVFQQDLDHAPNFGDHYEKKSNGNKLMDAVLPQAQQLASAADKTLFIYEYLVKKLKWNGNHSVFTRLAKLDDIYAGGEGSSAELNMMLYVLLKEAGIPASLMLVSTRGHGKMYEDYPILDQFNHLLVLATPDGTRTLLDATDPLRPPGYPSVQALNGRALVLVPNGTPYWTNLTAPADATSAYNYALELDADGTLTGSVRAAHKGYSAMTECHARQNNGSDKAWQEYLEKKYPDVTITASANSELNFKNASFYDTVHLRIPNVAEGSGGFMYLAPLLHSEFDENIFKSTERYYPVDIPYPIMEQQSVKLSLPQGYTVESLPAPVNFSLPANGGSFRFVAEEKTPGQIEILSKLTIKQLRYMPDEYPGIKELFDLVVQKFGEQIVLKVVD